MEQQEYIDAAKESQSKLYNGMYKEAWEWASSFTKEERVHKFKESIASGKLK